MFFDDSHTVFAVGNYKGACRRVTIPSGNLTDTLKEIVEFSTIASVPLVLPVNFTAAICCGIMRANVSCPYFFCKKLIHRYDCHALLKGIDGIKVEKVLE